MAEDEIGRPGTPPWRWPARWRVMRAVAAGFGADSSGGGTGLANIRAHLSAMFGSTAELMLARRHPRGLLATVRMPLQVAPAAA